MSRLDIKSARRLRKKGDGACVYAHNFLFFFYYLFIFPYRFQAPPIAAGTLLLGPLLPSRSPVPFVRLLPSAPGAGRTLVYEPSSIPHASFLSLHKSCACSAHI